MTGTREPVVRPPGDPKTLWRSILQGGSKMIQDRSPLKGFDVYVAGFHCAKCAPQMQMEAHHSCRQVNSDFIQCALFDGLPEEEKTYWRPHNYEILSGQSTAPGLPEAAEHALMKLLVNSYGKTRRAWRTSRHDGEGELRNDMPFGVARLMWSFNRDGEPDETLKRDFNAAMGVDEDAKRKARADLAPLAHPQRGVDAMRAQFPRAGGRPEGVVDADAAAVPERT